MAIPEWKVLLLVICGILLVLNEALWQWRWWRLDTTGVGVTNCSGNQILIPYDSTATICQPCPICTEGMILSPPCGSILTLDTVMECKSPVTRALMGSRRKKSERKKSSPLNKLKKAAYHGNSKDDGSIRPKNVNGTAWPSLDVSDHGIYEEEELEDSNLSEIADLHSFLSLTHDVQGVTTVTPTKPTSLSKAFHRWRDKVNPKFSVSKRAAPRPPAIARPPAGAKTSSEQPKAGQMNKGSSNFKASSQDISISCVLGGFLGTSLACLLSGLAILWLLWSLQKLRGRYRLNGTAEKQDSEMEEMTDFDEKAECMSAMSTSVTSVNLKHLNLSEMPPDLDYLLVKTLDMRRKGERRYGWQKVGAAFKISKDDLEYRNLEYRMDNGSPTSTLLAILGTKGKTISDLENVLRSPKVKLPKVASLIRRHIREANRFQ